MFFGVFCLFFFIVWWGTIRVQANLHLPDGYFVFNLIYIVFERYVTGEWHRFVLRVPLTRIFVNSVNPNKISRWTRVRAHKSWLRHDYVDFVSALDQDPKSFHQKKYFFTWIRDKSEWTYLNIKTGQLQVGLVHKGFRTTFGFYYYYYF